MATFVLSHRHHAVECAVAFVAWKGFDSPLRHRPVLASCRGGGHRIWWVLEARDPREALALLPPWVAVRTEAVPVEELPLP